MPNRLTKLPEEEINDKLIPMLLHEVTKMEIQGLDFGKDFVRFHYNHCEITVHVKSKPL